MFNFQWYTMVRWSEWGSEKSSENRYSRIYLLVWLRFVVGSLDEKTDEFNLIFIPLQSFRLLCLNTLLLIHIISWWFVFNSLWMNIWNGNPAHFVKLLLSRNAIISIDHITNNPTEDRQSDIPYTYIIYHISDLICYLLKTKIMAFGFSTTKKIGPLARRLMRYHV